MRYLVLLVAFFVLLAPPRAWAGVEDEEPTRLSASDIAGAPDVWRHRAESGDAQAQFVFGYLNEHGLGVPWDAAAAAHWFELAATQGEPRAAYELGRLRLMGTGIERSYEAAAKLFQQAADKGSAEAETALGDLYSLGVGVPSDTTKALALFKQAADQGNAAGQLSLGLMYSMGRGTARDPLKAVALYRLAADQGNAAAQYVLGQSLLSGRTGRVDYAGALHEFQLAADQHAPLAESVLAGQYLYGWGTEKDPAQAAKLYQAAADGGSILAEFRLGQMNQEGIGVPRNPEEARRLYELAAQRGVNEAAVRVGDMFVAGEGGSANLDQAASWYRLAARRGSGAAEDRLVEMLLKKQVKAAKPGELTDLKKLILVLTTRRLADFEALRQVASLLLDQEQWAIGSDAEGAADDLADYLLLETELTTSPSFPTEEIVGAVVKAATWSKKPPIGKGTVPAVATRTSEADRAKRLLCFAVGAHPDLYADDAILAGFDEAGIQRCHDQLIALQERLAPLLPPTGLLLPGQVDNDVSIVRDRASRRFAGAAQDFAVWGLPDDMAGLLRRAYALPRKVTVSVRSCHKPALFYDPKAVALTLCYEYADDLVQKVVAHVPK